MEPCRLLVSPTTRFRVGCHGQAQPSPIRGGQQALSAHAGVRRGRSCRYAGRTVGIHLDIGTAEHWHEEAGDRCRPSSASTSSSGPSMLTRSRSRPSAPAVGAGGSEVGVEVGTWSAALDAQHRGGDVVGHPGARFQLGAEPQTYLACLPRSQSRSSTAGALMGSSRTFFSGASCMSGAPDRGSSGRAREASLGPAWAVRRRCVEPAREATTSPLATARWESRGRSASCSSSRASPGVASGALSNVTPA